MIQIFGQGKTETENSNRQNKKNVENRNSKTKSCKSKIGKANEAKTQTRNYRCPPEERCCLERDDLNPESCKFKKIIQTKKKTRFLDCIFFCFLFFRKREFFILVLKSLAGRTFGRRDIRFEKLLGQFVHQRRFFFVIVR